MSMQKDGSGAKVIHGGPEPPIPDHHSVGQYFYDRLIKGGDKIAQIDARTGVQVTYRRVLQQAVNTAEALEKLGVRRGDLALICSENCFDFTVATIGIIFTGATLGLANVGYSQEELTHALSIAQPKLVVCSAAASPRILRAAATLTCLKTVLTLGAPAPGCSQFSSLLTPDVDIYLYRPCEVVGSTDAVVMLYSSGTTGLAKGVLWNHITFLLNLEEARYNMGDITRTEHTPTALMIAPWSHAFGFISVMGLLANHYRGVFFPRFNEESFFRAISNYKVNLTFLVPSLMVVLTNSTIADRYDLSSIRQIWGGSEVLSKKLEQDTCKRFGVPFVKHGYASTESGLVMYPNAGFRHGSVGQLTPGVSVKVVNPETGAVMGVGEPGELLVRSRKIMLGYRGDAAATRASFDADGFLRTGDILYYDEDLYFYVVDRIKELIKYKGFQVPPAELEGVLQSHPAVQECGVVGIPDERAGELPLAFVALRPGARATEKELQEFVATKVSSPKKLRGGVRFVERIPRNLSGKVLRRELRALLDTRSKL